MGNLIEQFYIVGISIRTQNAEGKGDVDIPQLWGRFMQEGIAKLIQNRVDSNIYCLYTDYEGDQTQPYTTVIGCKVDTLDEIPEGLLGWTIGSNTYKEFKAEGKMSTGFVFHEWLKIWSFDLDRTYNTDFEVYDEKAPEMENAKVSIFVGIKNK